MRCSSAIPTLGGLLLVLIVACGDSGEDQHDTSPDADADQDSDADTGPDADTGGDADGDSDGDSDGDADGDSDGDTDGDADSDADAPAECPADMVEIPGVRACIDQYEASQGTGDVAESVSGVLPWVDVGWPTATAACAGVGKRLCTEAEWIAACQGSAGAIYPWGDTWELARCNDAEADSGGEESLLMPTGSFALCEGGVTGLFDMAGNAWEWTADCNADGRCIIHGGSYRNGSDQFQCANNDDVGGGGYGQDNLGFRCCLTLASD